MEGPCWLQLSKTLLSIYNLFHQHANLDPGSKPPAAGLKAVRNITELSASRSPNALQARGQDGGHDTKEKGLKLTIIVYVLAGTLIIIAALLIAIIWLWKGNKKKAARHVVRWHLGLHVLQ